MNQGILRSLLFSLFALLLVASSQTYGQSFSPVPWPSDASFRPIELNDVGVKDPRIQDQSNGGATPQGYVNFASGVPDTSIPSVFMSFDGSTIFIRMRMESSPSNYAGGATAGNADPYYSAVWHQMYDFTGDGWGDIGITLDGASGSPSAPIDVIRVTYSNLTTRQCADPTVPGVYTLGEVYATQAYTSGLYTGQLKQYDGNAGLVAVPWPQGRYTTQYDYGTSRVTDLTTTDGYFILDFQVPLSMLDATPYGGPQITGTSIFMTTPVTGQNTSEPFKKDMSFNGLFDVSSFAPAPGSDPLALDSTATVAKVIVRNITASGCPSVTLTTSIMAPAKVVDGKVVANSLTSLNFYYWVDSNINGLADDGGSSWTLIGPGTAAQFGTYTATWNTAALTRGQYIVKAIAVDQFGNTGDSYAQTVTGYTQVKTLFNNGCGVPPASYITASASPTSVDASGTTGQRNIVYTVSITNPGTSSITLSSITDSLPSGFTYRSDTTGGTITPTSSPAGGSTGAITWNFAPVTINAGTTQTFMFNVTAGTTSGTFSSDFTGTGSSSIVPALNTAPVTVTRTSAVLSMSSSTGGAVIPGQSYSYTITYTNNGNLGLTNATIVDTLPIGVSYSSSTGGGSYNASTREVTWNIGALAAGATGSVGVTVVVTDPYEGNSTQIVNDATLSTTELSGVNSNTIVKSVATSFLTILQTAAPTSTGAGGYVTYTMTYGNPGNDGATGVTIVDTLPTGFTYVSGSSGPITPTVNGQILTWTIGALAAGSENNTITYQAAVDYPYPSVVTNESTPNTAYISSNENATTSSAASVLLTTSKNTSIAITSDALIYTTTDSVTYTITLTNYGDVAATLTTLRDSLPSGFTYGRNIGGTLSPTTSPTTGSSGTITWTFAPSITIQPESSVTLIFRAKVANTGGDYTTLARAVGSLTSASTDSISSTALISVEATGGATTQRKTADKVSAVVGDTITYTFYYKNVSGGNQAGAKMRDTLPSGLRWITSAPVLVNGSETITGSTYTQLIGNPDTTVTEVSFSNPFATGDSISYTQKAVVIAGATGILRNKGAMYNQTTFLGYTNSTATTVVSLPNITLTNTVDRATAPPNATLTYTIIAANSISAGTATNVILLDTLPANVTFVSGSASDGGAFSVAIGPNGRLRWNLGTLSPGESDTIHFSVTVNAGTANGTVITNPATLTNTEGQTERATASTTVAALPTLTVSNAVDKSSAAPGDTLTYTLTYTNTGNASALSTVLKDTLPAGTTFVSATGGGTNSSGIVTWNIGSVAASGSGSVTVKVLINSPIAANSLTTIQDRGAITATGLSSVSSNTVTTTVRYPSLSISDAVDSTTASPGSTVTYTLIVSNASTFSSTATTIFDTLATYVTYVPNSTTWNGAPAADVSGNSPLLAGMSIGTLDAGETDTITFQATVNPALANGLFVDNTAYATNSRVTDVEVSNTSTFVVRSSPILTIAVAGVASGAGAPGDSITYTITYGNVGNTGATSVRIEDAIPSNTTYLTGSVSGTGASFDLAENEIVISLASLGAGVTGQTATFRVLVNSPLTSGTTAILDTATISASNASSAWDDASTNITAATTLAIIKSGIPTSTLGGSPVRDTVTFYISYSTSGTAVTDSVYLNDELPAGLNYISSTLNGVAAGSAAGQTVTWNVGSANPARSGSATVTAWTSSGGTYNNSASVTTRQNPTGVTSNTATTTIAAAVTGVLTVLPAIDAGDRDTISVDDADLKGEGFIFVTALNLRTNETEIIGLTETGTNTGIFTATIPTTDTTATGTNSDGYFYVAGGDSLRVTYDDAIDATNAPRTTTRATYINITSTPNPPIIVTPADGSITNDDTPAYIGTSDPNDTIRVYVDGVLDTIIVANGAGNWSYTTPDTLTDGPHTVYATARDLAGTTSAPSDTNTFTVDSVPPGAPVVVNQPDGTITNDNTPLISGTSEANALVHVYLNGVLDTTVTANGAGNWSYTSPTLPDTIYDIHAFAEDAAGNLSVMSNVNQFEIDTVAPAAPVVVNQPDGTVTSDNTPLISGTSEPNVLVHVYLNGVLDTTVTANGAGNWSYTSPTLPDTIYDIHAFAEDDAGNTSVMSNVNQFEIDTVDPAAPVVVNQPDGTITNDNTPLISGTSEPNVLVHVYLNGVLDTTVTANGAGNWSYISPTLPDTVYDIHAFAEDDAGNVSVMSNVNQFTIDTVAPNAPVVVNQPDGTITTDNTPLISGTSEPNVLVDVYLNGVFDTTVTASGAGTWSYTSPTLPDTVYDIHAFARDDAGNTSVMSNVNQFEIDTVAPSAPVVVNQPDGTITSDNTPLISGTSEANVLVHVYLNGVLDTTVTSDGSGNWSYTSPTLPDTLYDIHAFAEDDAGNISVMSNVNQFEIDSVAPLAPVVINQPDGTVTPDTTPLISGTSEANVLVHVYLNGVLDTTVTSNGSGNWSYTSPDLPDTVYDIHAIAEDDAGNISPMSNVNQFTILSGAPNPPVVVTPADGSITNDDTPTYVGTSDPNDTIKVYVDGILDTIIVADGSGNWSYTPPDSLTDGSHTVYATATNIAGVTSTPSATNTFTVDSVPPAAPVVVNQPDGTVTNDNTPLISGTSEPNMLVHVYLDGVLDTTVTADGAGNWSYISPTLPDSIYDIHAFAEDDAGNISVMSNVNQFEIDTDPPAAPVVVNQPDGTVTSDNTPLISGTSEPDVLVHVYLNGVLDTTVTSDGSGNWSYTSPTLPDTIYDIHAFAEDDAGNISPISNVNQFEIDTIAPAAPVVVNQPDGTVTSDNTPLISGTSEPNMSVDVYLNGVLDTTIVSNGAGNWSYVSPALPDTVYDIHAFATDDAGNVSPMSNVNQFTIDTTAPGAPVVVNQPDGTVTTDDTPVISGTAEPNITVEVYLNGVLDTILTSDGAGNWSYISPSLPDTMYAIHAVAVDDAGNDSPNSNTNIFTIDTTPPGMPTVVVPADGDSTTDTTPLISGTAEPLSTVSVYVDGLLDTTLTADGAGTWSYVSDLLALADYAVYCTAIDSAGNISPPSNTNTFTVYQLLPPSTPTITGPPDGTLTTDTTPEITGTGDPGSTIIVYIDGDSVGTTVVGPGGTWTFTPPVLTNGPHTVKAKATGPGGTSPETPENDFTIDATPPNTPVITGPAQGSTTNDNTPEITGTAEPNSTVNVYVGGVLIGTTTADPSGDWTLIPGTPLPDGLKAVTVTATDAAGNTSPATPVRSFTINTVPVLTALSDDTKRACSPDFTLTVTGSNFLPTSVVRFNGSARSTVYISSTQLTADILASDLTTVGTYPITVYTPPTGGGTTSAMNLTVVGGSISGRAFFDRDGNGSFGTTESAITGWTIIATGTNPANDRTTTTQAGGVYTFSNLNADTYTIVEEPQGNYEVTVPGSGSYSSVSLTCGADLTGYDFANANPGDTTAYLTFTPDALAEKKAESSRVYTTGWTFEFTNTTGITVTRLRVRFVDAVCSFLSTDSLDAESATLVLGTHQLGNPAHYRGHETSIWDFTGRDIADGETVTISGISCRSKRQVVSHHFWAESDTLVEMVFRGVFGSPVAEWGVRKMPNRANVRNEVFARGGFTGPGLVVGVPHPEAPKRYGWVTIRRSNDLQRSLISKVGYHTGEPRGFAKFANGRNFIRAQRYLSPNVHNNILFAEMLALKFNIAMSALGVTPIGFGELIYEDGNATFDGLMITDVAARVDTMLTEWGSISRPEYLDAYDVVQKLNRAFLGEIDTVSYGSGIRLRGVIPLSDVDFLRPNPTVAPKTIPQQPYQEEEDVPEVAELFQNYPNPFNPSTVIEYTLPTEAIVTLKVYNMLGQEVATLHEAELMTGGDQEAMLDGSQLPSGIYFYRLSVETIPDDEETPGEQYVITKKMILLK